MKHQINETHLGNDAAPISALRMAEVLTCLGFPSEYTPKQGGSTSFLDADGEEIDIPDAVWFSALRKC